MYRPIVETEVGERLHVWHDPNHLSGKSVMSLVMGVTLYCNKEETSFDGDEVFKFIEERSSEPLCSLFKPLNDCIVYPDESTEIEDLERSSYKLVDIKLLIHHLRKIVELLEQTNTFPGKDNVWFRKYETLTDFQALLKTAEFLKDRHKRRIRIVMG